MDKKTLKNIIGVFDFDLTCDPIVKNTLFKNLKEEDCEKAFKYLKDNYDLSNYYRYNQNLGLAIATERINSSINKGDFFFFCKSSSSADNLVFFQEINDIVIGSITTEILSKYNDDKVEDISIIIREFTKSNKRFEVGDAVVVSNPTDDYDLGGEGFNLQAHYNVREVGNNTIAVQGTKYYKSAFSVFVPEENRKYKIKPTITSSTDDGEGSINMEIPSCTSEKPIEEAGPKPNTGTIKPVKKQNNKKLFTNNTLKRRI